jgi:hypothetical protein
MLRERKNWKRVSGAAWMAGAALLAAMPVMGHVGGPVQLSLGSGDEVRAGEPVTVIAVLQAGAAVQQTEFRVEASEGWQILGGDTFWVGSMAAGERKELRLRAVPLGSEPGMLMARLRTPGHLDMRAGLDPQRMGGRFPERVRQEGVGNSKEGTRAAAAEEEPVTAEFEPGVALPEPANATMPQVPGREPDEERFVEAGAGKSGKGQKAAAVNITATGRFTYLDDNNVRRGARNATVELWNKNDLPFLDERCAAGITDAAGNFTLTARCGDLFDGPDLFVRMVLNNSVVEVKPDNVFAGSYVFQSTIRQNSAGGAVNFGTMSFTGNRQAIQAHNLVMRAQQFMAAQGETMGKVTVNWPATVVVSFYNPFFQSITLDSDVPFAQEMTVFHEYGHHVLSTKAESPAPDYDNGICDDPQPGHCLSRPEKGVISWTEGFPNFLAAFLHDRHNAADGYGAPRFRLETIRSQIRVEDQGQEDQIELVIAGILWDLTDAANDDEAEAGAGRRDRLSLPFSAIWDAIRNFDPSPDLFHNHPTSIHELWDGLRAQRPADSNAVSEIYREHFILKPQPDLRMTAAQDAPASWTAGTSVTLSSTAENQVDERANNAFRVQFNLVPLVGTTVEIGGRTVAAGMAAGASSTANTLVTVPANTAPGSYRLQVCADSLGAVPESSETNNCLLRPGFIVVR